MSLCLPNEASSFVNSTYILILSAEWNILICQLGLCPHFACWMKFLHMSFHIVSLCCLLHDASLYVNSTCILILFAEWSFFILHLNLCNFFICWTKLPHMSMQLVSLCCLLNEASLYVNSTCIFFVTEVFHMSAELMSLLFSAEWSFPTCQLDLHSYFFSFWMKLPHMSARLVS